VACPERADNPIHHALASLDELSRTEWDQGNQFYPPSSFQISNIHAGDGAENVIPESLTVWFNFRFCTEQSADRLRSAVEAVLDRHGVQYTIDWRLSGQPFLTPGGRLVELTAATIKAVNGVNAELSTGGGTSDGRFIAPLGVELIELGPNNGTIHKINESVELAELDALSEIYQRLMVALLPA